MVTITKEQIKTLTGEKCPKCEKGDVWDMLDEKNKTYIQCPICEGTGLPTIEIDKECICGHLISRHNYDFSGECSDCSGGQCEEFKPKYKVEEEISICPKCGLENYKDNKCGVIPIKLKIVSEIEDNQKLQMVR